MRHNHIAVPHSADLRLCGLVRHDRQADCCSAGLSVERLQRGH